MKTSLIYIIVLFTFIACDTTNENDNTADGVFKNLERGGDTKTEYTYFDFDSGKIIDVDDPATNSIWDVGFGRGFFGMQDDGQGGQFPDYRSVIITNGGTSGAASGAGYLMTDVTYNDLIDAPTNINDLLELDAEANGIMDPALQTGSGTWYNYDFQTHHLVPNPNAVMIIKTAEGKLVKSSIISLYKLDNNDVPNYDEYGFITFRYEFLD